MPNREEKRKDDRRMSYEKRRDQRRRASISSDHERQEKSTKGMIQIWPVNGVGRGQHPWRHGFWTYRPDTSFFSLT